MTLPAINERRLKIYLADHRALMVAEVELVGRCRSNNRCSALGDFLRQLDAELRKQQSLADDVFQRLGGKDTIEGRLKQGAAWFAEKLGRFKRNDSLLAYSELSRLVEVEALAAAAQARLELWDNLESLIREDPRFDDVAFSFLREQSQRHLDQLHMHRRHAARDAFARRS
jgi:hypothetical protein